MTQRLILPLVPVAMTKSLPRSPKKKSTRETRKKHARNTPNDGEKKKPVKRPLCSYHTCGEKKYPHESYCLYHFKAIKQIRRYSKSQSKKCELDGSMTEWFTTFQDRSMKDLTIDALMKIIEDSPLLSMRAKCHKIGNILDELWLTGRLPPVQTVTSEVASTAMKG